MRTGNLARLAALALLSLALGGCLSSKKPLFNEAQAVAVLGDGGHYQTYEATDAGGYKTEERINVHRKGRTYEFTNTRGIATAVSFYPLRNGAFAGQILAGGGELAYVMVRLEGRTVYLHKADCDKQDQQKLAALGVEIRDRQCLLDKVTDPQALYAALDFGPPASKMEPAIEERRRKRHAQP